MLAFSTPGALASPVVSRQRPSLAVGVATHARVPCTSPQAAISDAVCCCDAASTSASQPASPVLDSVMHKLSSAIRQGRVGLRRVRRALGVADAKGMLAMGFAVPTLPGAGLADLFANKVFMTGFWAFFAAQFLKVGRCKPACICKHEAGAHSLRTAL